MRNENLKQTETGLVVDVTSSSITASRIKKLLIPMKTEGADKALDLFLGHYLENLNSINWLMGVFECLHDPKTLEHVNFIFCGGWENLKVKNLAYYVEITNRLANMYEKISEKGKKNANSLITGLPYLMQLNDIYLYFSLRYCQMTKQTKLNREVISTFEKYKLPKTTPPILEILKCFFKIDNANFIDTEKFIMNNSKKDNGFFYTLLGLWQQEGLAKPRAQLLSLNSFLTAYKNLEKHSLGKDKEFLINFNYHNIILLIKDDDITVQFTANLYSAYICHRIAKDPLFLEKYLQTSCNYLNQAIELKKQIDPNAFENMDPNPMGSYYTELYNLGKLLIDKNTNCLTGMEYLKLAIEGNNESAIVEYVNGLLRGYDNKERLAKIELAEKTALEFLTKILEQDTFKEDQRKITSELIIKIIQERNKNLSDNVIDLYKKIIIKFSGYLSYEKILEVITLEKHSLSSNNSSLYFDWNDNSQYDLLNNFLNHPETNYSSLMNLGEALYNKKNEHFILCYQKATEKCDRTNFSVSNDAVKMIKGLVQPGMELSKEFEQPHQRGIHEFLAHTPALDSIGVDDSSKYSQNIKNLKEIFFQLIILNRNTTEFLEKINHWYNSTRELFIQLIKKAVSGNSQFFILSYLETRFSDFHSNNEYKNISNTLDELIKVIADACSFKDRMSYDIALSKSNYYNINEDAQHHNNQIALIYQKKIKKEKEKNSKASFSKILNFVSKNNNTIVKDLEGSIAANFDRETALDLADCYINAIGIDQRNLNLALFYIFQAGQQDCYGYFYTKAEKMLMEIQKISNLTKEETLLTSLYLTLLKPDENLVSDRFKWVKEEFIQRFSEEIITIIAYQEKGEFKIGLNTYRALLQYALTFPQGDQATEISKQNYQAILTTLNDLDEKYPPAAPSLEMPFLEHPSAPPMDESTNDNEGKQEEPFDERSPSSASSKSIEIDEKTELLLQIQLLKEELEKKEKLLTNQSKELERKDQLISSQKERIMNQQKSIIDLQKENKTLKASSANDSSTLVSNIQEEEDKKFLEMLKRHEEQIRRIANPNSQEKDAASKNKANLPNKTTPSLFQPKPPSILKR